jgi:large subunit ribosomal protein L19
MHPIIARLQKRQIEKLCEGKVIPDFKPGDTVKVNVKIQEGATERIQAFQGTVIARRNRGINSCFQVRKISHKEGVERTFMIYAPNIKNIEVVSRGVVRRAKLYYLRDLTGKAAKIKQRFH